MKGNMREPGRQQQCAATGSDLGGVGEVMAGAHGRRRRNQTQMPTVVAAKPNHCRA